MKVTFTKFGPMERSRGQPMDAGPSDILAPDGKELGRIERLTGVIHEGVMKSDDRYGVTGYEVTLSADEHERGPDGKTFDSAKEARDAVRVYFAGIERGERSENPSIDWTRFSNPLKGPR